MLVIGLVALRGRELVAGVLGVGALSEAVFVRAFVTVHHDQFSTPFYAVGTLVFGVIMVVGLAALIVVWRAHRREPGPAET